MQPAGRRTIRLRTGELQLEGRRFVPHDGDPVGLTAMEVGLLSYLLERPGRAVSRGELLQHVWGYHASVRSRAVDQTVKRLRRKIEVDAANPQHLVSEAGVGYRLQLLHADASRARLPLMGRVAELEALDRWWTEGHAGPLVLWGPGGVGKSHLARAWAAGAAVPGGVYWVSVQGEREGLAEAVLRAVPGPGGLPERLAALGDALVVLDGVEGMVDDVSELLTRCLDEAPHVGMLATTQRRVPLSFGTTLDVRGLDAEASTALFVTLGDAVAAGVVGADPDGAARVVAATGGYPLALQWVASRVGLFSPTAMADRLERHDGRLWKDGLDRALTWSWTLLPPYAQAILKRIVAAFRGGFPSSVVVEVLDDGEADVVSALQELRDASWIVRDRARDRLSVPSVVRAFLGEVGGPEGDRERHAAWVLGWVRSLLTEHPWGTWRPEGWTDAERSNLRHAADRLELAGAKEAAADAHVLVARVAVGVPGAMEEAWRRAERAVTIAPEGAALREALRVRGALSCRRGDDNEGERDFLGAIEMALAANAPDDAARVWLSWGEAANRRGQSALASEVLHEARQHARLPSLVAPIELELARACCQRGDATGASAALERARPHLGGVPMAWPRWHYTNGYVALEFGRPEEAQQHFQASLQWASEHGRTDLASLLVGILVVPALLLDDLAAARSYARKGSNTSRAPVHVAEDEIMWSYISLFESAADRAEEHARAAWVALRRPRGPFALYLRGVLARAAAIRGDADAAHEELVEALRWAAPEDADARAIGLLQRALVESALGHPTQARELAVQAVAVVEGGPDRLPGLVRLWLHLLRKDGVALRLTD